MKCTDFSVWTVSCLERIHPDDGQCGDANIELFAARGEYTAFQVIVSAGETALTNASITVTDLTGENVISSSNMTLYREHYVYLGTTSHARGDVVLPRGVGWYPDALIPFVDPVTNAPPTGGKYGASPFDVEPGKNQPIWIDIFVPRCAKAGEYAGEYKLTCDQGEATGRISFTVWDFELPVKPSLRSVFLVWHQNRHAVDEIMKHRLMADRWNLGSAEEKSSYADEEQELIDEFGLTSVGLGFWSEADIHHAVMKPPPSVEEIKAAASRHHPELIIHNYTADEICDYPELHEPIREWARNLHEAGVKNLIVMTPTPLLFDDGEGRPVVDIFVVLPVQDVRSRDAVLKAQELGCEVWSYNTCVQDEYSPKWQLDYDLINYRIHGGFLNQAVGLTGLLYWRVDNWKEDPWKCIYWMCDDLDFNADGILIYPGEPAGLAGVAPSMRLKALRDSVQDYEYIQLLKNLGHGDWALETCREAGEDWKNWTKDPEVLLKVRKLLGDKLNELRGK